MGLSAQARALLRCNNSECNSRLARYRHGEAVMAAKGTPEYRQAVSDGRRAAWAQQKQERAAEQERLADLMAWVEAMRERLYELAAENDRLRSEDARLQGDRG